MIAKNNRNPLCDRVTIVNVGAKPVRAHPGWWLVSTRVRIPAYSSPQAAAWVVAPKRIVPESQLSAAELQRDTAFERTLSASGERERGE